MAMLLIGFGILRLGGRLLLPEIDLASQTLRTLGNGLMILSSYIVAGHFLLAPQHPERRLVPLPRAESHFRRLAVYAVMATLAAASVVISERAGVGKLAVGGLFTMTASAVAAFKLWWFYDARGDLERLVLSNSDVPSPGLRLIALVAPWFYMAVIVVIWMVGCASVTMIDGTGWAKTASVTQIVLIVAPVIALGFRNLLSARRQCRVKRQTEAPTPQAVALSLAGEASATGVVWAIAFYMLARLWAGFFVDTESLEFIALSRQAAGIAVLLFLGWVALVFIRAVFDAYAPRRAES